MRAGVDPPEMMFIRGVSPSSRRRLVEARTQLEERHVSPINAATRRIGRVASHSSGRGRTRFIVDD